jgi:Amt family ammonium transporter
MSRQFGVQLGAIVVTVAYTAVVSFVILKVVDALMGLRVSADEEQQGLDVVLHDESGYRL